MKELLNRFRVSRRSYAILAGTLVFVAGCTSNTPAPIRQAGSPVPTSQIGAPGMRTASAGTHVVRPGDTLMGIGRLYGKSVGELISWNRLADPNQLTVGQALRVAPSGADTSSSAVAVTRPVSVESGVATTTIKQTPKGGTQPYNDQAWASAKPQTQTPSTPTPSAAKPPETGSIAWLWPASGTLIAKFSEASNKGVDISGKPGDTVIASAAGKVAYSGSGLRGYGKLIIIRHNDEYLSAYAHNQTLLVKEGEMVTKGQKIAELGSTDADRPKLHFEIRRKGRPVDPMQYLPAR